MDPLNSSLRTTVFSLLTSPGETSFPAGTVSTPPPRKQDFPTGDLDEQFDLSTDLRGRVRCLMKMADGAVVVVGGADCGIAPKASPSTHLASFMSVLIFWFDRPVVFAAK